MVNIDIETLMREKAAVSKLLKKSLFIARTFSSMGDNTFASDYFVAARTFASKLCSIESQIKQREPF